MWPFQGGGDWEKSAISTCFVLFWVRNKTKKLSSRKFFIKLRQLISRNLLESWEGRFMLLIKSKS
jgi:hypothetical protein